MGHDEDKNNFDTGNTPSTPVAPNPLATITGNNRLGMRPSRNVSAAQAELDRISADSNPNKPAEGDIVLNDDDSKIKISPKVIALIVLVVVSIVAAIASVFYMNGGMSNLGKKSDEKTAYLKILQYGDAESEKEINKELSVFDSQLYRMAFDEVSVVERSSYSNKLLEAYKQYESDGSDQVLKLLEAYNSYMTLEKELDEIEKIYLEKGEKSAKEYFMNGKSETDDPNPTTNAEFLELEVLQYKYAFVGELAEYSATGCIVNGVKNESCIEIMRANIHLYPNLMQKEQIMFTVDNEIGGYAENATKQLYNMSIAGE